MRRAMDAGMLHGLVTAMDAYPLAVSLQINACWVMRNMWFSIVDNYPMRKLVGGAGEDVARAMESALENEEVVAQLGVTRNAECRNVIEEIRMAAKTLGEQLRVSE